MTTLDNVDATHLETREWQLWLLAFAVIAILTLGIALLMYPSAFSDTLVVAGEVQRKAFFGFCTLSVLLMVYLLDRQMEIRNLRREIDEKRQLILRVRQKSSADLLQGLPGLGHFEDQLTMEHRRAASGGKPLSLVLVSLSSNQAADAAESSILLGDAAKALLGKLRGEDSLYFLGPGVFCTLLPGVEERNAHRVADRLAEGLRDASGVSNRFEFGMQTFNYPEHFKSAHEIEKAVRPFIRSDATPTAA